MTHRLFAAPALLVLLLLAAPAFAGPVGVLRADAQVPQSADLAAVERALELPAGTARPASLPAATGAFHLIGARLEGCAGSALKPQAVLDQARDHLRKLEADAAIALLAATLDAVPCSWTGATNQQVATLLDLLGQAAQDAGKDGLARDAYRRLLALSPSWQLLSPPGTGYEVVWTEVRREVLAIPQGTLVVWHGGTGVVRLDGEPVPAEAGATLPVLPGRHLLQWSDGAAELGAWLVLDAGTTRATAIRTDAQGALLSAGGRTTASRQAVEQQLGQLRSQIGADAVAVLTTTGAEAQGYAVDAQGLSPWSLAAEAATLTIPMDRLRAGIGGGYLLVDRASYAGFDLDLDLRLVGPLHVRIDGTVAVSQPSRLQEDGATEDAVGNGRASTLPGLGGGVVLRLPKGVFQPFVAVVGGVWLHPLSARQADIEAIRALDPEGLSSQDESAIAAIEERGDASPRILLEGGFDVISPLAPVGLRFEGGIGYGPRVIARAGLQFLVRLGKVDPSVKVGG